MALAALLVQLGIIPRHADFLGDTQANSITAGGTGSKTNATQLSATINRITTINAGSAEGVMLPSIATWKGTFVMVRNDTANNGLVYSNGSDTINNNASGVGVGLNSGVCLIFAPVSSTKWIST